MHTPKKSSNAYAYVIQLTVNRLLNILTYMVDLTCLQFDQTTLNSIYEAIND